MTSQPVENLVCGECKFVNEPERVFCHSCGAKLDRSVLVQEETEESKEANERLRKKVKQMTNPKKGMVKREVKAGIKTILAAVLVATVVVASRAPELPAEDRESVRLIGSELAEALTSPQPRRLVFSEAELNGYIRQTLRAKPGNGVIPGFEFKRPFIKLDAGTFWIGMEHSMFGYPVYTGVEYKPVSQNGRVQPELQGGSIGRLHIPKVLMSKLDFVFNSLLAGFKRDEANLKRIAQATVEKGRMTIITPAATPAAAAAPSQPLGSSALSQPGATPGASALGQPHLSDPASPDKGKPLPPPPRL